MIVAPTAHDTHPLIQRAHPRSSVAHTPGRVPLRPDRRPPPQLRRFAMSLLPRSARGRAHQVATAAVLLVLFNVPVAGAQEHDHPAGDPETLGTVTFASSCAAEVADELNRAVAMLH